MRTPLAALVFAFLLPACPLGQQSGPARAQEAARELNVNARFGRMELASELVAPKARQAFFLRRRTWGNAIRVADYEMAGMRMEGEDDAEMFVRIAWYRVDEGDLHVTTLKQKWHDFKGDWRLVDETRSDGDIGLLGEPIVNVAAPEGRRNAHFPTLRIGGGADAVTPSAPAEPADAPEAAGSPAAGTSTSEP